MDEACGGESEEVGGVMREEVREEVREEEEEEEEETFPVQISQCWS